ncbi:MAG: alpha-1,6-mannanase [Prevotella sp.]|nr:alpha-1,6-mannanase [Prevotella sp.]
MKKRILSVVVAVLAAVAANAQSGLTNEELAVRNLERAIEMTDNIFDKMFITSGFRLRFFYNANTGAASETVSVWEYTSALEATNSVLEGLIALKETKPELYNANFDRYVTRFSYLYRGLQYYRGKYTESAPLISYTGPNAWNTVYGVHRANSQGNANVQGIENVYDDQMWIIRELVRAYNSTGVETYLTTAEILAAYVLDGWDCNLKANGEEYGGITWGPGYTSKHSCSNGPLISPLVWLSEIYSKGDRADAEVTYYALDKDGRRYEVTKKKSEYYLDFARKIFKWQLNTLRDSGTGVFWDAAWASTGDITYREIDGVKYRVHLDVGGGGGDKWTYNTGVMISGAADLYRVTGEQSYLTSLTDISGKAHTAFTSITRVDGVRYRQMHYSKQSYNGTNGSPWFNDVLERGFIAATEFVEATKAYVEEEQACLDYAYDHHIIDGFMPINLIKGWDTSDESNPEQAKISVMYALSRASEYGMMVKYQASLTGIKGIEAEKKTDGRVNVYSVDGRQVRSSVDRNDATQGLQRGIYLVGGEKIAVR